MIATKKVEQKVSKLTVISFLSTNGKNTVVDYRVTNQNKLIVNAIKFWLFLKEIRQKKHSCTPCTFITLGSISFEEIFDWSECALWLIDLFQEKLECYRQKTRPQWCLARTQDTLLSRTIKLLSALFIIMLTAQTGVDPWMGVVIITTPHVE